MSLFTMYIADLSIIDKSHRRLHKRDDTYDVLSTLPRVDENETL